MAGSCPDVLVASAELMDALANLTQDATQRASEPAAATAFKRWRETASAATGAVEDIEIFASEAAFAASARIAIEAKVPAPVAGLKSLFPHLFGSPLFSWYEPAEATRLEAFRALRAQDTTNSSDLLGWLYQFSIPEEIRKRFGQFYTRPAIVEGMLDNLGFSGPKILEARLIDPAVGAGAFAIGATGRVIAAAEEAGMEGADVCQAVQRVVYGLDLNPLGILLTEAAIALMLVPHLEKAVEAELDPLHLYVTDSLRSGELAGEEHGGVVEDIKLRRGPYEDGFAYVIANPPYAKYPSRLMNEDQKRRFAATTYGHPNLYGLFLQVGVELLADDGRLSFINPKSFVSGLYFRNLRRFLTRDLDLERFDTFDRRTGLFDGVLQDVVILTGQKRPGRVAEIELREFSGPPTAAPARSVSVARESVLLDDRFDHAFFISADDLAHRLLTRMTTETQSLRSLGFKAVTGTIVWNRLKSSMRDAATDDALPLVWGNGIRSFRFVRLGNRQEKATHVELNQKTREIVSRGEAILVKRMTAKEEARRLVACRVPPSLENSARGWFAENHVNVVKPVDPAIELDAVLGLLNSSLYDYVFRSLNGNTQVSATELDLLPVKQGPELQAIAAQARKMTAADGNDAHAREQIDHLVANLFGLSEMESRELASFYSAPDEHAASA